MSIQQAFNSVAADYDQQRRLLIPCFDDFYQTAIAVIPHPAETALKVLDLGAGTGLFAAMVQAAFPRAELTLIDLAEDMLEQAKLRFQRLGHSPKIVLSDYSQVDLQGPYDLVISALSIHHLDDLEKERLYQRIYQALRPGGLFVNADQVLGETPALDRLYRQQWLASVKASGISPADLEAALQRMEYDRMAMLKAQLHWLGTAGFVNVDCWYKNFSFAVFGGNRPI